MLLIRSAEGRAAQCVALLLFGCDCGSPTTVAVHDAAPGVDAAEDTESDPVDAAPDAAVDSGLDPDDPGWTPLSGLPDWCVIEYARQPAAVFRPSWEACEDRGGCQRMRAENSFAGPGFHDGERGFFVVVPLRDTRATYVIASTEGAPLGAWRQPHPGDPGYCAVGEFSLQADGAAFVIGSFLEEQSPTVERIFHSSLAELGRATTPVAVMDETFIAPYASTQETAASADMVAVRVEPGSFAAVVQGGKLRRLDHLPDPMAGQPFDLRVVDQDVFWAEYADRSRIAQYGPGLISLGSSNMRTAGGSCGRHRS
jgi:hypothetical protein